MNLVVLGLAVGHPCVGQVVRQVDADVEELQLLHQDESYVEDEADLDELVPV